LSEPTLCCGAPGGYCDRCDLLVGLDGLHVITVERDDGGGLTVTVESAPAPMGCRSCGVVAHAHGRVEVRLVDAPAMGRPVRIAGGSGGGFVRTRAARSARSWSRMSGSRRRERS
jgi:hypothetical protein